MINGTNHEILQHLLFDKHLTEDEHSLLDDLIENRLYQISESSDADLVEVGRLELLRIKITKWRG